MANLAMALAMCDECAEAESLMRDAQAMRLRVLGESHLITASGRCKLGWIVHRAGRLDEAEPLLREGLAGVIAAGGPDHFLEAIARAELGDMLIKSDRGEEAVRELEQARAIATAALGAEHQTLVDILERLARAEMACDNLDQAETAAREAVRTADVSMPPSHFKSAAARGVLGMCRLRQGRTQDGVDLLSEALTVSLRVLGESHRQTILFRRELEAAGRPMMSASSQSN